MNIAKQGSNRVYTRETDEQGRSIIRVEGTNRDENRGGGAGRLDARTVNLHLSVLSGFCRFLLLLCRACCG